MNDLSLPDDLMQFSQAGRQLDFNPAQCETGAVILNTLPELKVATFHLQTYASPLENEDPHKGEAGFYHVPAVSLLKECENYLPQFLLVWLPQEGLFGTGDEEHGHLQTFPGATWSDIAAQPVPYLEAQWDPDSDRTEYLRPWPKYEYGEWTE